MLSDYFEYLMTFVLCLTLPEYFNKYDGKNMVKIKIPLIKEKINKKEETESNVSSTKSRVKNTDKIQITPIRFIDVPAFKFFKDLDSKRKDIYSPYSFVTIGEVKNKIFKNIEMERTKEEILRDLFKYEI